VAIELGLSEKEATRDHTEYWRLMHLYNLHSIYKENSNCRHIVKCPKTALSVQSF
jgi:hypothetical protein